jgi:broad specificity phosphatase PhoE
LNELYQEQYHNLFNKPDKYIPLDGEDFNDVYQRVREVIDDLVSNTKDSNLLIVTHAIFIKVFLLILREKSLAEMWNTPFIHGTSLTLVDISNGNMEILMEADTRHLRTD